MKNIKVVQPPKPEPEVPAEIIATSIVAISQGIKRLRAGRLNDRALHLLIQHAAPAPGRFTQRVSIAEVRVVLEGLESLERTYLKKRNAADV